MSDRSPIEWTDATWNPVRGCTKVSPGCKNCYAERFAERFRGVAGHPFEQGFDLRLVPHALRLPSTWKMARLVFVNSMSDLFHEEVPETYIRTVFEVMAAEPRHRFQILTKRSERLATLAPRLPWPTRGVPFFFKQWGGEQKKRAGRLLDGREWNEMPIQTDGGSGKSLGA
ncbi:MAG: DUF5131 family protein [Holophagales bacterium]|nr:DUF5131 family protein [Holophagales bacterium]